MIALAYWSGVPQPLRRGASFLSEVSYALYLAHWLVDAVVSKTAYVLKLPLAAEWAALNIASLVAAYII